MPPARRHQAKRVSPARNNPGPERAVAAAPVPSNTPAAEEVEAHGNLISDTTENATFSTVTPGQQTDETLRTEVNVGEQPQQEQLESGGDTSEAARLIPGHVDHEDDEGDNKRERTPRDNGPGKPRGYILQAGETGKKIPVRRVPGNDKMVEAREPVWVERSATGSDRKIHTLLLAKGTVFPKAQLDNVVL